MFADKTKDQVYEIIRAEYGNAKEKWGDYYASLHEGYAVLAEEVFECKKEYKAMKNTTGALFKFIATGVNQQDKERMIKATFDHARLLAMEACQVAAVCLKMLDGVGR